MIKLSEYLDVFIENLLKSRLFDFLLLNSIIFREDYRTKLKEHEHSLFEFINTLNRKYIGKYYLSYHENSEKEEFVFFQTDHESSYTFGLNPAQLIADCHSLKQNIKDIGKQFVDMLYEKGIYK